MTHVTHENNPNKLKLVLQNVGIEYLCWIDDEFAKVRDGSEPLQEQECIQKIQLFFDAGNLDKINNLIQTILNDTRVIDESEPWGEVRNFLQDSINETNIEAVLNFIDEPIDLTTESFAETMACFKACLGENRVISLGWHAWQERINNPSFQYDKTLFLVDYSFKNEDDVPGDGGDIVKGLVSKNIEQSIVFILTHDKSPGEPENILRNEICSNKRLDPQQRLKLSVVSKKHLNSTGRLPSLEDRLAQVIKSVYLRQHGVKMLDILKQTLDDEIRLLNDNLHSADAYEIENVIFKSARDEGGSEIDLLKRLMHICTDTAVTKAITAQPCLFDAIAQVRKVQLIDVGDHFPRNNFDGQLSNYRYSEIFDDSVNFIHSPLAVGDMFEAESNGIKEQYVLIAQECDLALRDDGIRLSKYVYLLKTQEIAETKKNDKQSSEKFNIGTVQYNNRYRFIVELSMKNTHICQTDTLDLCVFNTDGALKLSQNQINDLDRLRSFIHLPGWRLKFENHLELFQKSYAKKNNPNTDVNEICELTKSFANFSFNNTLELNSTWIDAQSFGIANMKRIKRLKPPYINELVRKFFDYRSRTAFDHDFTT